MTPRITKHTWDGTTGTCQTVERHKFREVQRVYNLKSRTHGWAIHNQTLGEVPTLYTITLHSGGQLSCDCALSRKSGIRECVHKLIVREILTKGVVS